jgi:hypothetical protein
MSKDRRKQVPIEPAARSPQDMSLKDLGAWERPDEEPEGVYISGLVSECLRLRLVPLRDFTAANLHILIGQKIALDYLVPMALVRLASNPWLEARFFPGDLLRTIVGLDRDFWRDHPDLETKADAVVTAATPIRRRPGADPGDVLSADIRAALDQWRATRLAPPTKPTSRPRRPRS